jgi:hypothetical protein
MQLATNIEQDFNAKFDVDADLVGLLNAESVEQTMRRLDDLFSTQKLQKWQKSMTELLEQMMVNCFVKFELLTDHFLLLAHELRTSPASFLTKLPAVAESLKTTVRDLGQKWKIKYHAYKEVFSAIDDVLTVKSVSTERMQFLREVMQLKAFEDTAEPSEMRFAIKAAEAAILQIMASHREQNSATLAVKICFKISNSVLRPTLAWKPTGTSDSLLEILWADRTLLHIARLSGDKTTKTVLDMGDQMENQWLLFSSYREPTEICVCVGNEAGSSVCLVDLERAMLLPNINLISAIDPYRIAVEDLGAACVKAQQLPANFPTPRAMAVSTSRRLASIYGGERRITIDLEPEDEE